MDENTNDTGKKKEADEKIDEKKVDLQGRKWLLTINNPIPKGLTHEEIKRRLLSLKSTDYICMSDEIGKTHHTHIFVHFEKPKRFSTLHNLIEEAHIDRSRGTCVQNRDYVFKQGEKWEKDTKKDTNLADTHEEWGEMPVERQGARNDLAELYEMIQDGMSNYEIINENSDFIIHIERMEKIRQTMQEEAYKEVFRTLEVTYIYGDTGAGKTRSVMEKYGYSNVYRVTNYKNPFDQYKGQDVIIFDEFYNSLPIRDMLKYLDGYPLMLPCRYTDKVACFTKVYLLSNTDLKEQYIDIQEHSHETWRAFLRRIHKVQIFKNGKVTEYSLMDYLYDFQLLTAEQISMLPFDDKGGN